ncbi:MAG: hypothetical protein ACOC1U_02020 [Spirochaetota bacterium]
MSGSGMFPMGVVYLVLLVLEGIGVEAPLEIDYLQDGVPAYTISVEEVATGDRGRYRLDAAPTMIPPDGTPGAAEFTRVTAEESDLLPHRYLVVVDGSELPALLNVAPLLSDLSSVSRPALRTLEVPGDAALAGEGVDLGLGTAITIVRRGEMMLVSSADAGIVLLMSEE